MSRDKPVPAEGKLATQPKDEGGEGEASKRGFVSWALGWLGVPALVLSGIFGGGALIGANFHDSWMTRAFVWIGDLF